MIFIKALCIVTIPLLLACIVFNVAIKSFINKKEKYIKGSDSDET